MAATTLLLALLFTVVHGAVFRIQSIEKFPLRRNISDVPNRRPDVPNRTFSSPAIEAIIDAVATRLKVFSVKYDSTSIYCNRVGCPNQSVRIVLCFLIPPTHPPPPQSPNVLPPANSNLSRPRQASVRQGPSLGTNVGWKKILTNDENSLAHALLLLLLLLFFSSYLSSLFCLFLFFVFFVFSFVKN